MSEANPPTGAPADNGQPARPGAAVIRRVGGAEETAHERLVKKHLPAWVVSGGVHLVVILMAWLIFGFGKNVDAHTDKILTTSVEKDQEDPVKDLTNEDPGLESTLSAALPDKERLEEKNVDAAETSDPIGVPDAPSMDPAALKLPGLPSDAATGGAAGAEGNFLTGGGGDGGLLMSSFPGRSGSTKNRLLKEGGGNEASELAVALGLAWLARQQKPNGSWVFDGSSTDKIASTGLALLPFLAAGQTHKHGKYMKTVSSGLDYLKKNLASNGKFGEAQTMYAHGIGTMALCEAYGMTKDKGFLLGPAQAAINFIVANQAADGSWGYAPGTPGDTSIVGWQVQALQAARLTKDIVVPDKTFKMAIVFLDRVSSGSRKSKYGYTTAQGAPGTSLTAVGLLSRYYIDGWGPGNAGMAEGVAGLMTHGPLAVPAKPNMYYYYYATQVVHFFEGPEWKDWNEGPLKDGKRTGGMRDWMVLSQIKKDGTPNHGSWDPDGGFMAGSTGRLGTTCMCLLTLEVYYRHLPLYKRDNAGMKAVDAAK